MARSRTAVPENLEEYGYGPEHLFFADNRFAIPDLPSLTPEEAGLIPPGQAGTQGQGGSTTQDVVGGIVTGGGLALLADKLTGGAISSGIKDVLGIGGPTWDIGEPWATGIDPEGSVTGLDEIDFADDGIGAPVLPEGYSSDFAYQPVENVIENWDTIWNHDPDPWGITASGTGYGSTFPYTPTTGILDMPSGALTAPHDPNPFGLTGDYGSTYDFGPGETGPDFAFDPEGGAFDGPYQGGDLPAVGGGDAPVGEPGFFDSAGNWISENIIGGPQEAETLWGMEVGNRLTDALGGATAIYGAVQDPRPDTILQGVGGAAAIAGALPGFGLAYGLYNGIIAGMKFLTGAGQKVPWGAASIPVSDGSFGNIEVNGGYGGNDLAVTLGTKAAAVQTELMTMAQAQGIDLNGLLANLGDATIMFQPTGTQEQPDVEHPVVRVVTSTYDDRGQPQDAFLGIANSTGHEGVSDPKQIAAAILAALSGGQQGVPAGGGRDYGHAEGGEIDAGGDFAPMFDTRQTQGGPVSGPGGGQDDLIPAMVADGEHVLDAEQVSMLGDGSNDEGHRRIEDFKAQVRSEKRQAPDGKIPRPARGIGSYFKGAA